MSLYDAYVWFDLHQLLGGDFDPRRTKAYVTTNVENDTLIDTTTSEIRMGDQAVTFGADGTGEFATWIPGADGNPTSWQTSLHVDYARTGQRDRKRRTFGPYTIDHTVRAVTTKALTSNVATLTLSQPHGLRVDDAIVVYDVDATFNGSYTITATPSPTTLSYAKTAANVASTAATGTIRSAYVSLALLEDEQAIPPTYETTLTARLDAHETSLEGDLTTHAAGLQTSMDAEVTAAQTARTGAETARTGAETARALAEAARDDAVDISNISTSDGVITAIDNNAASAFRVQQDARLSATIATELPPTEWSARSKSPLVLSDLRTLHQQVWKDLEHGLLQTRKAAYSAAIRYAAAVNTSTQKLPGYASLTAGLGDNTIFTTDKAWLSAVTAVYNLTTDPTRATNLLTAFIRNTQTVTVTVGPTVGDTIEVQGTAVPYQGLWAYQTPATPSGVYWEIVDFDDTVVSTSNGTGGSTQASPNDYTPLVPKLPLPSSGSVTNDSYVNDSVLLGPNYATVGTDPRGATQKDIAERNPVVNHDASSAAYGRFRKGFRFWIVNSASTRGVQQTSPQTMMYVNPLGGAAGGWPSKHLNVAHALVRVVDSLVADAATYPVGRLFLMVATRTQTGNGGQAGTASGGISAIDIYALPGNPDYFDGMVTL